MESLDACLCAKTCFSWGSSFGGKLGCIEKEHENNYDVLLPKSISSYWPGKKEGVFQGVQVSCGYRHTLFLLKCGRIMASGSNKHGQCSGESIVSTEGHDVVGLYHLPIEVQGFDKGLETEVKIKQVSAGFATSYALAESGEIYSWGDGKFGALGRQNSKGHGPSIVGNLLNKRIIFVSAGRQYCACLTSENRCFAWGRNHDGQVGCRSDDHANSFVKSPTEVLPGLKLTAIVCGASHTLALVEQQDKNLAKTMTVLYGWGDSSFYDSESQIREPREITAVTRVIKAEKIEPLHVAAGGNFSLMLDARGRVYSWGIGTYGQLGSGRVWDKALPKMIEGLHDVVKISAGTRHCFAILKKKNQTQKELWSWGYNSHGELGLGDCNLRLQPHKVCILLCRRFCLQGKTWHS
mmetsp:Transcript_11070/g.16548  ORF Transcript_11070/g.16548 Transcript_11070/m.16548 type:complete len:408 (-) Transcript_11070:881-2104(-)